MEVFSNNFKQTPPSSDEKPMDVTSYFENVLGTSYMVRIQFANEDYIQAKEVRKGKQKRIQGGDYISQAVEIASLEEGQLSKEATDSFLGKMSEQDRKKAEIENSFAVLLVPRTLRGVDGTLDSKFTHEALLAIPADVSLDGELSFPADWKSRSPWMPRALLSEKECKGVAKAEIAVGAYADYDAFVNSLEAASLRHEIDTAEGVPQWRAYLNYCTALYDAVLDCPPEKLEKTGLVVDNDSLFVVRDTNVNASAGIEQLYHRIRTQEIGQDLLVLYKRLIDFEPRSQTIASLDQDGRDEALRHAGTASRDFPLADSQRLAVHRHGILPDGEVLAVSGPPGTGKTTLLQSVVADLLVRHALAKALPPVIVGCSTNNQAVTNIIDAFTKDVAQASGTSVFRRWLPDVVFSDGSLSVDIDKPLHSFGVYSPSSAKRDASLEKGYLIDGIERRSDGLYQFCSGPSYSKAAPGVYREQASAYFGGTFSGPSDVHVAIAERLQVVDSLRKELIGLVPDVECATEQVPLRCSEIINEICQRSKSKNSHNSNQNNHKQH